MSKSDILREKQKSKSRFPECSMCGKEVHSKALVMRCLHPVCIVCASSLFKEPKDIKCNDCNTFEHLLSKFYSCLADTVPLNLKQEAEKLIVEETKNKKDGKTRMKGKLDKLFAFDNLSHDLAKFNTKCENMIVSGNINSLFAKKR